MRAAKAKRIRRLAGLVCSQKTPELQWVPGNRRSVQYQPGSLPRVLRQLKRSLRRASLGQLDERIAQEGAT